MTKLANTFLFLLTWISLSAQVGMESGKITSQYIIDEDLSFLDISTSVESGIWDISAMVNRSSIEIQDINSNTLDMPFIGRVKLDLKRDIIQLQVSDLLGGYKQRWTSLIKPLRINEPYPDQVNSGYIINLGADQLETQILDQLPIRPDSIRVVLSAVINDQDAKIVDLIFKTDKKSVYSFLRTIEVERTTFIKIEPFGWEPVNEIAPMIDWDQSFSMKQRFFIDENINIPIGILEELESTGRFAYLTFTESSSINANIGNPEIKAVPNPVINDLRFTVSNLEPGRYKIRIKNILGELTIEKVIDYTGPEDIPMDINLLRKGSYFYSLEDSNGNTISTKRLIVLRP